jgi:hypothetical protein
MKRGLVLGFVLSILVLSSVIVSAGWFDFLNPSGNMVQSSIKNVSFSVPISGQVVTPGKTMVVTWTGTGFSSSETGYLYLFDKEGTIVSQPYQDYINKKMVVKGWSLYGLGGSLWPTLNTDLPEGEYQFVFADYSLSTEYGRSAFFKFGNVSEEVYCTSDMKACPDGSYVSRDPENDCEFNACPSVCTDSDGGYNKDIKGTTVGQFYHNTLNTTVGTYTDYCYNNFMGVIEYYCSVDGDNKVVRSGSQNCSNGCLDGACISKTNTTYSCTDSDGGLNYYERGYVEVKNSSGSVISSDWDDCNEEEFFCYSNGSAGIVGGDWNCPNGCSDGACINEFPQDCLNKINFLKNPSNVVIDDFSWILNYGDSWNGEDQSEYYASWQLDNKDNRYGYVWGSYSEFDNKESIEERLNYLLDDGICRVDRVYSDDHSSYENVYICKNIWKIASDERGVSSRSPLNYQNDVLVIWFKGNSMFNFEFSMNDYYSCHDEENCENMQRYEHQQKQNDLISALDKIMDNEAKYTSPGYLDYLSSSFVSYFIGSCGSDVEESDNNLNSLAWFCKTEPVICPPHGEQKQICTAWNSEEYKEEVRETSISCSPGICSGCTVPKWFEGSATDNKCIPYGFRFENQIGFKEGDLINDQDQDILMVSDFSEDDDVKLSIIRSGEATLQLIDYRDGTNHTYTFSKGDLIDFSDIYNEREGVYEFTMFVNDVVYDSQDYQNSYVDVTFYQSYLEESVDSVNAYCDIDGQVKVQKVKTSDGSWASCQNNYECESNFCSGGECVEINDAIREASGMKRLVFRALCRITNLFDSDGYNQCLLNNLGE